MTFKKESSQSTSQEVTPEKVSRQVESAKPACERLLRSKKLFHIGDYAGSLKENQTVLSLPGKNSPKDQALFQMGLIYAHLDNPQKDFGKALDYFKKVFKDYPKSPLADEARVWAGVLQENQKLNQVIEKTKQVDISVEEKKREKAR
jgi:TolA-binding protein